MAPIVTRFVRCALAALAIASLFIVSVQGQGPLVREHYSGTDSFSFSDCGFVIEGDVMFSGLFMLKKGHHGDPTPYYFDNYEAHFVFTNPTNGKWFTVDQNGLYKDLRITNTGGTIYTFEAIEVGRPFVVRDMEGKVIINDRGLLQYQFTVDTKGDSDLANDEFLTEFEIIADRGAHAFIDFCELASNLLL